MRPLLTGILLAGLGMGAPGGADAQIRGAPPPPDTAFSHDQHEAIECTSCHSMDAVHGESPARGVEDCRSCHHTEEARRECTACHDDPELRDRVITLDRTLSASVLDEPSHRALPFRHGAHEALECSTCHTDGPSLAVPELDCQSCHEEHHTYTTTCLDCHGEPTDDAHDRTVHATCSGSGCHQEVPVTTPVRTRAGCLWCHQDLSDHRQEDNCVRCHLMPPGGGGGTGGGGRP